MKITYLINNFLKLAPKPLNLFAWSTLSKQIIITDLDTKQEHHRFNVQRNGSLDLFTIIYKNLFPRFCSYVAPKRNPQYKIARFS